MNLPLTVVFFRREALRRYEELAEIFSDKDNYSQSRELLKEVSFCGNKERINDSGNKLLCVPGKLNHAKTADIISSASVRNLSTQGHGAA